MTDELARRLVGAAFLAAVAGASPPALLAQGGEAGVFVRDSVGNPIAGVQVSIPSLERAATTNAAGRAAFAGLDTGTYVFRARRVGFEPAAERLRIGPRVPVPTIIMRARTVTLDTVRVAGNVRGADSAPAATTSQRSLSREMDRTNPAQFKPETDATSWLRIGEWRR